MAKLTIKVDAMAGCDCTEIIHEMCRLSSRIGVGIESSLNGVTVIAQPFCDMKRLCSDWHDELLSDHKHKFAFGQPITLGTIVSD